MLMQAREGPTDASVDCEARLAPGVVSGGKGAGPLYTHMDWFGDKS